MREGQRSSGSGIDAIDPALKSACFPMQSHCDCLLKVQSDGSFTETRTHTVCPRMGRETEDGEEEVEDEEEDEEVGREMLSAFSDGGFRAPLRLPPLGRQGHLFF